MRTGFGQEWLEGNTCIHVNWWGAASPFAKRRMQAAHDCHREWLQKSKMFNFFFLRFWDFFPCVSFFFLAGGELSYLRFWTVFFFFSSLVYIILNFFFSLVYIIYLFVYFELSVSELTQGFQIFFLFVVCLHFEGGCWSWLYLFKDALNLLHYVPWTTHWSYVRLV